MRAGSKCALGSALALLLWCSAALAQGQPAPPLQPAPPPQPLPGAGTQPPGPPNVVPGLPSPESHREQDPFLKYAQNVKVTVTQVELGSFPTVRAFVSVTDENGITIGTLGEGDFTVEENGVDAGEVKFANRAELDLPLAIYLVVDISGSMGAELDMQGTMPIDLEKKAIHEFVSQLDPRDRVGLITFADAAYPVVRLTTDHDALLKEVDELQPWGQTTLWDGIRRGMEELVADTQPARRALIVLSDGMDNKSIENPGSDVQWYNENAVKQNIGFSVYTLGLGYEVDRGGLGNVAAATGGVYLDSPSPDDLARVYQDILKRIQSEYLLEYTSPAESKVGQIIDVVVGLKGVKSYAPGKYTYRSPGLSQALARALWPGLVAIAILLAILIIATIYKITRRAWLTMMITPLEGKDWAIGEGIDIGTLETCDLRVSGDPAMLPIHATLRESHDGYMLEAVDPQSPVIMAGKLLARRLLRSGDAFTIGTTAFVFHERALRSGEAHELAAEHYTSAPLPVITEEAQLAGQVTSGPPKAAPQALLAMSGPLQGQRFTLAQGENVVGRKEGTILAAKDDQVSRKHCLIKLSGGWATLTDLGSTNGTSLNGTPCQPGMEQPVFAGDVLRIGTGEYRLE